MFVGAKTRALHLETTKKEELRSARVVERSEGPLPTPHVEFLQSIIHRFIHGSISFPSYYTTSPARFVDFEVDMAYSFPGVAVITGAGGSGWHLHATFKNFANSYPSF